jgi:hypothetical protein
MLQISWESPVSSDQMQQDLQAFTSNHLLPCVYPQWFQSTVSKEDSMPETLKSLIFPNFEPLHKFHTNFLKEIEQRLGLW